MIKILHFADLHLGVENYGHINPTTGLSTCFGEFLNSLDKVVEFALTNEIDLVLFCGDAYKSRDPSQTHQREFAQRIWKLASNNILVFLLVGNHDLPNAVSRATTVDIFDTLAVRNIIVANHPRTYLIQTEKGELQIIALPWVRRSSLLAQEAIKNLTLEGINLELVSRLTHTLTSELKRLNPSLPAILAAHISLSNAKSGSEQAMMLGYEPVLPQSVVAHPSLSYVALGHIHKNQVLDDNPPIVYPGSLERIDFSDEEDEKGFYVVEIEGKRATFSFHPVNARRFLTIKVNVSPHDLSPTFTILKAIAHQDTKGAIVRVQITTPEHLEGLIQELEIRKALKEAQYVIIAKEVERERRTRLKSGAVEGLTPLDALKAYLEVKKTPPDWADVLLEYGRRLIQQKTTTD